MGNLKIIAEPGKHDVIATRDFDAPRDLVFKAYTDPALIPQWWGPADYETVVEAMDVKAGGRWRYVQRGKEGEFGFFGVYHEITAPSRIVNTYEFDGYPGVVGLVVLTLEEKDGKTLLNEWSMYPSVDVRDAVVASGMEHGAREMFERFDAVLESLK